MPHIAKTRCLERAYRGAGRRGPVMPPGGGDVRGGIVLIRKTVQSSLKDPPISLQLMSAAPNILV